MITTSILAIIKKVIIRTGSSLLGEIVSIEPNTSYFFEPLHSFKDKFHWKGLVAPKDQKFSNFILNLSNCDRSTVNFVRQNKFTMKKSKNTECLVGTDVVIKDFVVSISAIVKSSQLNNSCMS